MNPIQCTNMKSSSVTSSWTLLLFMSIIIEWSIQAPSCQPNQYWDRPSLQCMNCTNATDVRCQQSESDCRVDGSEFYNTTVHRCQACKQCLPRIERVAQQCNRTKDTVCIQTCSHEFLTFDPNEGRCILECSKCPGTGECEPGDSQKCSCSCERSSPDDLYCDSCITAEPPTSATMPPVLLTLGPGNSLPNYGTGLIAIGVVVGIVAFSACFLLMGVCSSNRRGTADVGSEGSNNSDIMLVSSRTSVITHPSYISSTSPFLGNHSKLDLLRHSPTGMTNSLSSIRGSPRSVRAIPLPSRSESTATPVWQWQSLTSRCADLSVFYVLVTNHWCGLFPLSRNSSVLLTGAWLGVSLQVCSCNVNFYHLLWAFLRVSERLVSLCSFRVFFCSVSETLTTWVPPVFFVYLCMYVM